MKSSLQSRLVRQTREITRLLDQNETAYLMAAQKTVEADFYRLMAEGAAVSLTAIRSRLNVPGHEHIVNERNVCAVCSRVVPCSERQHEAS